MGPGRRACRPSSRQAEVKLAYAGTDEPLASAAVAAEKVAAAYMACPARAGEKSSKEKSSVMS